MEKTIFTALWITVCCVSYASARQCQQCVNVKTEGHDGILKPLFGSLNPQCEYGVTNSVDCPRDGRHECGYFETKFTYHAPIFGPISISAQMRDCMPTAGLGDGCHKSPESVNEMLKVILYFLTLGESDLTGQVCYCDNIDLCDPRCKGPISHGNICVEWWMVGAALGGLVLLIVLLCTCCCCCCGCCGGCCRRRVPRGAIIVTQQPPLLVSTNVGPHDYQRGDGFANPGYGQEHQ